MEALRFAEPVMQVEVEHWTSTKEISSESQSPPRQHVDVNKKIAFTSIVGQVPLSEMSVIQPLYARLASALLPA